MRKQKTCNSDNDVSEWVKRKSSAALLIVCERNFLLLGADYSSADQR